MLRLRPSAILQGIRQFEGVIQIGATAALLGLGLTYASQRFGLGGDWVGLMDSVELAFGVASAVLLLLAFLIRTYAIRNPAEALLPKDRKGQVTRLRRQVFDWMRARRQTNAQRLWRFVENDADLKTLARLNYEGFALSSYSIDEGPLARRNRAIWERNRQVFALVLEPGTGKVVGYSCMMPLNAEAAALYLDGGFMDRHFGAIHIARPGEPYAAIVVFAIVIDRTYAEYWRRGGGSRLASFIGAVIEHGNAVSSGLTPDGFFLAQCEKQSIETLLEALFFERTSHVSAEGFPFYRLSKGQLRAELAAAGVSLPAVELAAAN